MSLKGGAGGERVQLDKHLPAAAADDDTLLIVDDAMAKLAQEDPTRCLHQASLYTGLTNAEARALGIAERTARRHWSFARVWLYREIRRQARD